MEQKTCTRCGAEKPATREFFHYYTDRRGEAALRPRCICCVLEYTKEWACRKKAAKPPKPRHPDTINCRICGLPTPLWFRRQGCNECAACKAIRRYPDRERAPFPEFRARLLLVAESKHLRRTSGQNKCQSCGVIHDHDETRHKRWAHLCVPCERLHIRVYRQTQRAKNCDAIGNTIRKAIRAGGESPTVRKALGYTIADLRTHLERQFTTGMTWERFIAGDIHIDHITPQAAFDLSDQDEWRACWSLGNLRPMWAPDNIAKGAHRVFLL